MNRQIKFRGLTPLGEWVYGYYYQWYVKHKDGLSINHYIIHEQIAGNPMIKSMVIPESVGQFTGLKDRNGVDIYEGDIIDSWAGVPDDNEMYIRTVVFDDNYGIMTLNPGTGYILCRDNSEKLFEVIGNIHDTHLTKQS